jgi:hypothetical protein
VVSALSDPHAGRADVVRTAVVVAAVDQLVDSVNLARDVLRGDPERHGAESAAPVTGGGR